MSEQYQRFKQNFFKQHPPSSTELNKPNQQVGAKSYKQYDPYTQYTSDRNNTYQSNDEQLRIQNETHFPFEQIEQTTFQDLQHDPFLSYKQQQQLTVSNDLSINKSTHNKGYGLNNNNLARNNYEEQQYRSYGTDHRDLPIRTESQLQYRTVSKHQYHPDNYMRVQQQNGIERVNSQLDKIKISRQQHLGETLQRNNLINQGSANFSQYGYQINKQYIVQNNNTTARSNNLLPVSPPKQLPVIYNRPNSHSNSQHKINPQQTSSTNSRVIIQQTPTQQPKPPVLLSPPPNPLHPVIINQPQTFNQIAQIPQPINSGSRVIIQSEINHPSKPLIQSSHNIPPPNHNSVPLTYNIPHQPIIVNSPPPTQVHFESRNHQEGMISMKEYQRLKSECSMWQQKFYQTNDQLTRLQAERGLNSYGNGLSQQAVMLREENTRLMEKIRSLQNSDRNSYEKIKLSYEELMKKYQGSLMKQANLLIDRFRLEMKHNQRY